MFTTQGLNQYNTESSHTGSVSWSSVLLKNVASANDKNTDSLNNGIIVIEIIAWISKSIFNIQYQMSLMRLDFNTSQPFVVYIYSRYRNGNTMVFIIWL